MGTSQRTMTCVSTLSAARCSLRRRVSVLLMRLSWLSVSLRRSSALPLTRLNCQYPLLDTFSFCPKYSSSCLALLMHGHGDCVPCLVLGRYHDCGSLPHVLPVDYMRCPNATIV